MKKAFKSLKENVINWIGGEQAAVFIAVGVLLIVAWLAGWLMGHAGGGVTMVFENAAYGLHGAAAVVAGVAGVGSHIDGMPLTTTVADSASPGLLRNEIDDRIVKIRPMSTPLDQISRYGGARLCGSMKVEYYSVDTRPTKAKLTTAVAAAEGREPGYAVATLKTDANEIFQPTTTIIVPSVKASSGGSLVLYVTANNGSAGVKVVAVNNTIGSGHGVPALAAGTELVRMGRAAAELDVMTSQFESLPTKSDNFCQIFKAQVEQSVLHRLAAKEVGITLSDQEEMALMDMRLGIEKSFLFGAMARIDKGAQRGDVFLTQGIWPQAGQQFEYKRELFTQNTLVEMARMAFTGNAGSSRKVLVAGSGLIETISKLSHTKVLQGMQTTTRWGLDFREIITNFGRLYVILSEVFDLCGHPDDGMVIDPEYIQKYVHIPFKATPLDLRSSGQRNCDAMVLTEASCLVLRYPNAHMRIVRKPA